MGTKWKNIIKNNISGIRPIIFILCIGTVFNMIMLIRTENISIKRIMDVQKHANYVESESFQQVVYDAINDMGQIYTDEFIEKLMSIYTRSEVGYYYEQHKITDSHQYELNGETYQYTGGFLVARNQAGIICVEEKILSQILNVDFSYTIKFKNEVARFSNMSGNGWTQRVDTSGIWLEYANGKLRVNNNTDYNTDALSEMELPKEEYNQILTFFFGLDEEELQILENQWTQKRNQIQSIAICCIFSCILWIGLWIYMKKKKIRRMYFFEWTKWLITGIRRVLQEFSMWTIESVTGRKWYKRGWVYAEKIRTTYTAIVLLICGFVIASYYMFWKEKTIRYDIVSTTCIGVVIFVIILYMKGSLDITDKYQDVTKKIDDIFNGVFDSKDEAQKNTAFAKEMEQLSKIGIGFEQNLETKIRAEQMKVELITNVSHDLKTPLTSIISYIDLLQRMDNLPIEAKEYVHILEQKSERLKAIVSDVFELAKTASGEITLNIQQINVNKLLTQTLIALEDKITDSGLTIKTHLCEEELYIYSDGQKLYRVLQNLLDNALKYSLLGTRIYIMEEKVDKRAEITLKNTANYEMDFSEEDVMERFFCGDKSRNTEGHGLGLSIAQGFTVSCGGEFQVKIDGDQFNVKLSFPISEKVENKDVKDI